jgi:hypothetical protein
MDTVMVTAMATEKVKHVPAGKAPIEIHQKNCSDLTKAADNSALSA